MPGSNLELIRFWNRGAFLAAPADQIPDGALRIAQNVRVDRSLGTISSRPGLVALSADLGDEVKRLYKLYASTNFSYAHVGNSLLRLDDSWGGSTSLISGLSSELVSATAFVDGQTDPWIFFAGPTLRKDDGSNFQNFGISAPTDFPNPGSLTQLGVEIMNFESAAALTGTAVTGLADDTTVKQSGNGSVTFAIAGSTLGSVELGFSSGAAMFNGTHTGSNNSSSLTDSGQNFDNSRVKPGTIVRNTTDGSEGTVSRIDGDTLFFDAGLSGGTDDDFDNGDAYEIYWDADFFHNNEKVTGTATGGDSDSFIDTNTNFKTQGVVPGMLVWNETDGAIGIVTSIGTTTNDNDTIRFSSGLSGGVNDNFESGDAYTIFDTVVQDDEWIRLFVRVDRPERIRFVQIEFDLDSTAGNFAENTFLHRTPGNLLNQGRAAWTEIRVRKVEFIRAGSGGQGWNDIRAARISISTNSEGAVNVWLDSLAHIGGFGIEGDIEWTATYRNSETGTESSPVKDEDGNVLSTDPIEAERQSVVLDLSKINNPSDSQIDQIRIYRKDSVLTEFTLVDTVDATTSSYTDEKHSAILLLAKTLEDDNDPPPDGMDVVFGPGGFDRLFGISNRNRLYFSKAWEIDEGRAENWPEKFFVNIGDGSEEALNGIALDQQLLVWSNAGTWQVIGQGPDSFVPTAIPESRGLAARYALASGAGLIVFLSYDGLYIQAGPQQQKVTQAIDDFFAGRAIDGVTPINTGQLSICQMEFHASPSGPMFVLLYPKQGSLTLNGRLVVKQGPEGQFDSFFFDDGFDITGIGTDKRQNKLLLGRSTGIVYEGEVEDQDSDAGSAIDVHLRTKAFDQNAPRNEKKYVDAVAQLNTNGQDLTFAAHYDRATVSETLGDIQGADDGAQDVENLGNGELKRNIALDLQGSVTERVTIFGLGWHFIVEAENLLKTDSDEISFLTAHSARQVDLDVDAAGELQIQVYVDGQLEDDRKVTPGSGRKRFVHGISAGLVGRSFRVVVTSSSLFRLYDLLIRVKPWGTAQDYQPRSLIQAG